MPLTITTPATDYPLALSDADDHLRGIYSDDDTHLKRLVLAAGRYVEGELGIALLNTVYTEVFSTWGPKQQFLCARNPLISVAHIKYYDADEVLSAAWTATNYIVNTSGVIEVAPDITLPDVSARLYPWTIQYTAGYGTAATAIPETLQQALRMIVEDFDRFRSGMITGTISQSANVTIRRLLALNDTGAL